MIGFGSLALFLMLVCASLVYSAIEASRIERQFPPIGDFADIDGVRLHYVDLPANDPDAPVIVFIHGASGNLRDPLVAFRSRFIGQFRLIFVDRPGHGYSTRGQRDVSSPLAQAELIHHLVANLGIQHAVIVGHSWGAAVASAYAVRFSKATSGLMLLAPATHPWPGGVEWYYGVATTPVIGSIFVRTLVMPIGQLSLSNGIASVFGPTPVPPSYLEQSGVALVLRPSEFIANADDVIHLKANVIAMAPHYREISAPTVIFAGREDSVVRNDLHAEALAREIPGARLVMIEDAGHMPQFSAPMQVADALEALAEHTRTHGYAELTETNAAARPR